MPEGVIDVELEDQVVASVCSAIAIAGVVRKVEHGVDVLKVGREAERRHLPVSLICPSNFG